jgi:DNA-binding transcriptional regulator YiaG
MTSRISEYALQIFDGDAETWLYTEPFAVDGAAVRLSMRETARESRLQVALTEEHARDLAHALLDMIGDLEDEGEGEEEDDLAPEEMGAEIRARREALGITAQELAARVGVSERSVYSWERGDCAVSPKHVDRLEAALRGEAP